MTQNEDIGTSLQLPKPAAELQRLNAFVGKWKTEGQQHAGPVGPAARVTAVQTFEWLPGNFFLIHRFDGRVGDDVAACIEITGYDAGNRTYRLHTYYNTGLQNDWQLDPRGDGWMLTGTWQMAGQATKVRCAIAFGDDGKSMTAKWESSVDGATWQLFWDLKAARLS